MVRAIVKLRRRQLGKGERSCSCGTIVARCHEQEKTTDRTRRSKSRNQGDRQPNGTGSVSNRGIDKRREKHEEYGWYLRESRTQRNPIRRQRNDEKTRVGLDLRYGTFYHGILCIFSWLNVECVL